MTARASMNRLAFTQTVTASVSKWALILLLILPVISACGFLANLGPPSLSPYDWLNAPAEQLIVAFGVPDSSVTLDNCERRYTWTTRRVVENRRGRFYLGKNGKLEQHPDLITSEAVMVTATTNVEGLVKNFQVTPIPPLTWSELFRRYRSDN